MILEQFTSNLGIVRRETLNKKEYLVAAVNMIVPGVLNGSQGPLLYPMEEIRKDYDAWNGIPLVRNHPSDKSGNPVSARSPVILREFGLGQVFNSRIGDSLGAEAWFDIDQVRKLDPDLLTRLESGKPVEVSTGLFTDNIPVKNGDNAIHNGTPYVAVARNYRPDHLAILPDKKGACSNDHGCGVNLNEEEYEESSEELIENSKPWYENSKPWYELVSNKCGCCDDRQWFLKVAESPAMNHSGGHGKKSKGGGAAKGGAKMTPLQKKLNDNFVGMIDKTLDGRMSEASEDKLLGIRDAVEKRLYTSKEYQAVQKIKRESEKSFLGNSDWANLIPNEGSCGADCECESCDKKSRDDVPVLIV